MTGSSYDRVVSLTSVLSELCKPIPVVAMFSLMSVSSLLVSSSSVSSSCPSSEGACASVSPSADAYPCCAQNEISCVIQNYVNPPAETARWKVFVSKCASKTYADVQDSRRKCSRCSCTQKVDLLCKTVGARGKQFRLECFVRKKPNQRCLVMLEPVNSEI